MMIFKWLFRQQRLIKRKIKLGEKFTSDWTWRKFSVGQLVKLNPSIDFNNVDNIYQIGCCNGQDKFLHKLKNLIYYNRLNEISHLNNTIEEGQDEISYVPQGDYLKTYVWTLKTKQVFVQLTKGSFDKIQDEEIIFQQNVGYVDIIKIDKRKLIYPV